MPGVLIETGFISNAEEEKYLMTEYGQEIIASAIYRGFSEYKKEIDRRSNFSSMVREDDVVEKTPGVEAQPAEIPANQVVFCIQIASLKNRIPTDPSSFKGQKEVSVIEDGRWYKYLAGQEVSYSKALNMCLVVKSDFPDAFVVALRNGKLIPLNEAIIEINK